MQDVGDEVERMRDEIKKEREMKKMGGGNNSTNLPPPSAFDNPDGPTEAADDVDHYGAFEQQRQAEILQEQDEALDGVFRTVGNLRQQAGDMGRELEEQVEMLEDTGQVADRVEGKLQNGMKRVGWVLKHNEGGTARSARWIMGIYSANEKRHRLHVQLLYHSAYIRSHPPLGSPLDQLKPANLGAENHQPKSPLYGS